MEPKPIDQIPSPSVVVTKRDPSKPLDNIKHELFAKALVANKGNQTKAYQEVYEAPNPEVAAANGSRVISYENVHERVKYLLEETEGLQLPTTLTKLNRQTTAKRPLIVPKGSEVLWIDDNQAQGSAINTALKLHGLLKTGTDIHIDNRKAVININDTQAKALQSLGDKLLEVNQKLGLTSATTNDQDGEVRKRDS